MDKIEEAIAEQWGERCPDFEPDCACCQAWKELDDLRALSAPPVEIQREDEPVAWRWRVKGGFIYCESVEEILDEENAVPLYARPVEIQREAVTVTRIDILREWFEGDRYARDYEYLDANYSEQANRVVAYLASLSRPSPGVVVTEEDYWLIASAAEHLRGGSHADDPEHRSQAAFRIASKLDNLRAHLAASTPAKPRPCTCHPDDNPPRPCPQKYALTECRAAALSPSGEEME